MAIRASVVVLLFGLAIAGIFKASTCQVVKGKVSCSECTNHHDFSGIKIGVKCANVKKLVTTTTRSEGSFEIELPSGASTTTPTTLNCLAKLIGGPTQICASRKNMVSKIVKAHESSSFTISTPLAFSTACPQQDIGSSKTVDLPLPREWGLAPSSYYVPFFPIIGIP